MEKKLMPQVAPSHVALVLPSVRRAADVLQGLGCRIGDEEVFEGEGTKEIYVDRENLATTST